MFNWCSLYRAYRNLKRAVEMVCERLAEIFDGIFDAIEVKAMPKKNRAFVKKPFYLMSKLEGRRCYRYSSYRGKRTYRSYDSVNFNWRY